MDKLLTPSTAMIFAAGFGKRMLPLTSHTPKPLIRVNGKPLIEYNLQLLEKWGVEKVIINSHHLSNQIMDYIDSYKSAMDISVIYEKYILETGGAIVNALDMIGEKPFLTLNSDVIIVDKNNDLMPNILNNWNHEQMDALMVLHDKSKAFGYDSKGDFDIDANSNIIKAEHCNHKYVFTGLMLLKPEIFCNMDLESFSVYKDFLKPQYMDKNGIHSKIKAVINSGDWFHVGTQENIKTAEIIYKKTIILSFLKNLTTTQNKTSEVIK
jgi:MurNAc alpha-1-phosphate uridylyltransferase